jgi:hypothetical protein
VDESGRTLGEIGASVKRVTDLIADISSASNEQAAGVEEVNRVIGTMDRATQQNAALVEQSAAATEALNGHARSLAELVAFFRLGTAQRGAPGARGNARDDAPARYSVFNRSDAPFQNTWMPMQNSRKADSRTMIVVPVPPTARAIFPEFR